MGLNQGATSIISSHKAITTSLFKMTFSLKEAYFDDPIIMIMASNNNFFFANYMYTLIITVTYF